MTTATINNKRVQMTIEEKARLLTTFCDHPDLRTNEIGVQSGSNPRNAYAVKHNGREATYCPCKAVGKCAHKVAADSYLQAQRRAWYCEIFNIYG